MSKTRRSWLALAAVAALVGAYSVSRLGAVESPAGAATGKAGAATGKGRATARGAAARHGAAVLETYAAPGGDTYFAMTLSPHIRQPKVDAHDVVVLFDTSASQTGSYREKAL